MLCAMDCMWRILGFQNYPAPQPTVTLIKPKLQCDIDKILNEQNVCDLAVYLARPQIDEFKNLLYTEFFKKWRYNSTVPAKYKDKPINVQNGDVYLLTQLIKPIYIFKRDKPEKNIVRMSINYLRHGEIWYLRLLLLKLPTYLLDDLKCHDFIRYNTFQESAVAKGYITNDTAALHCFNESKNSLTPHQLRSLFVNMTKEGYPTINIYNEESNRQLMYQDFQQNDPFHSVKAANNKLLQYISDKLVENGSQNSDFGLPEPEDQSTELQMMKLRYDANQQKELFEKLMCTTKPTDEQLPFLEKVFDAINNKQTLKIILQGITIFL